MMFLCGNVCPLSRITVFNTVYGLWSWHIATVFIFSFLVPDVVYLLYCMHAVINKVNIQLLQAEVEVMQKEHVDRALACFCDMR